MDESHTLRDHRVLSSHNVVASVEAKESSEILRPEARRLSQGRRASELPGEAYRRVSCHCLPGGARRSPSLTHQ